MEGSDPHRCSQSFTFVMFLLEISSLLDQFLEGCTYPTIAGVFQPSGGGVRTSTAPPHRGRRVSTTSTVVNRHTMRFSNSVPERGSCNFLKRGPTFAQFGPPPSEIANVLPNTGRVWPSSGRKRSESVGVEPGLTKCGLSRIGPTSPHMSADSVALPTPESTNIGQDSTNIGPRFWPQLARLRRNRLASTKICPGRPEVAKIGHIWFELDQLRSDSTSVLARTRPTLARVRPTLARSRPNLARRVAS